VEHGEEFLPRTCANYRAYLTALAVWRKKRFRSPCPEAARLVLLNPQLRTGAEQDGGLRIGAMGADEGDHAYPTSGPSGIPRWRWSGSRVYPLWQRLFLLGLLSRRFDAIAADERPRRVPQSFG